MTDKELEKIYNEAYRAVYWTAMSFLKNEADAEDIVQDTFVSFIKYYSDMNDTSKATALLKKIAANKCLDRIKLTRTDIVNDEFFENVEAVSEDFLPDSIIESSEVRKIIMDIINDALSEEIRRTLILFYFNDMSTKEISEKLGVPEGTVRWRLNFARNKIKKEVEKYEEDNDTKLFGMAALPFLSKLFMKEAEQLPMKAMPASLNAILSASKNAPSDGTGIKASKKAVKKGIDIMNKKLLIGCVAGVVAIGASVAIIVNVANKNSDIGSDSKPSDQLIQTESLQENESGNADGMTELDYTENNSASDNPAETQMPVLEPDETEAEGSVVVRAASVAEEDIVYASLDGMTAEEVIANLNNLAKIDSSTTFDNYGDRFQVDSPCVWCSYNDNQGNTGIGPGWGFAQDEDGGFHTELNGHAYLEWVGFRNFSSDGDNELIIRFYVSEDIVNDVRDALKEQLLSGGYVIDTDNDTIIMVHAADDISLHYSITYAGRGYFRIEMPCSVMK